MKNRQYVYRILTVFLILLAVGLEQTSLLSPNVGHYAQQIEEDLRFKEKEVESLSLKGDFFYKLIDMPAAMSISEKERYFEQLKGLEMAPYTLLIYKEDQLLFWSNNRVDFEQYASKATQAKLPPLLQLASGDYCLIQKPIQLGKYGLCSFIGLIPIKYNYLKEESKYLKTAYTASALIPENLLLTEKPTDYPLKSISDTTLCYLEAEGSLLNVTILKVIGFLYLLGFIFFGLSVNYIAAEIVKKHSLLMGSSFLVVILLGLGILKALTKFTNRFEVFDIFTPQAEAFGLSHSIGDLLINVVLLLWVVLFLHQHYIKPSYAHLSKRNRFGLFFLHSFVIVFAIINVTNTLKELIYDSNIDFDFASVINFDQLSFFAILSVILSLIALFLFTHLIVMMALKINLSTTQRQVLHVLAVICSLPLFYLYHLDLPLLYFTTFIYVYLAIFDLFIDIETNTLTWQGVWLMILALMAGGLLHYYTADKNQKVQEAYAVELTISRDSLAEVPMSEFINALEVDSFFDKNNNYPIGNREEAEIKEKAKVYYNQFPYLYNNYDYQIALFVDNVNIIRNSENKALLDNLYKKAKETNTKGLRFLDIEAGLDYYLLKRKVFLDGDRNNPMVVFVKFVNNKREHSRVYTELHHNKSKEIYNEYEYAIYKNSKRIETTASKEFSNELSEGIQLPPAGQFYNITKNNILNVCYRSEDSRKVVFVRYDTGGIIRPLSLSSALFAFMLLLVGGLSVLNMYNRNILPDTLKFSIFNKPSLRNRIQFAIIMVCAFSFIAVGYITVVFFNTTNEEYHESRLERKTKSVIRDTEHELSLMLQQLALSDTTRQIKLEDFELEGFDLKSLSRIHRLDMNLFDVNGELLKSSEMDIFRKGIVSNLMNPVAFQALSKYGHKEYTQAKEYIGQLEYRSSYLPLSIRDNTGERLLGFLGVPYYSQQSSKQKNVTNFMRTLINVYVILLIIAGGIVISVANTITRPITKIGEKLKQFKLGGINAPLEWTSEDELGELIKRYNEMTLEIQRSAEMLAQSEREDAWREMAKQVAHEIKNPLTPMKLSIQYLQHAYRSNPEDIEPLLKRVSHTLIEQIDNLSYIASEFSNFAKMPRAENQEIYLNELVESVYDLFKEHRDKGLKLHEPLEAFYVYADKNHLMRVFNNLIKNAIQAIPDEREGKIDISVYRASEQVIVKVQDNGTGISEELKEKVFVPNFTTKNSGTGLGLAISRNIIEAVEGKIYFDTVVGEGTAFYVRLPIKEVKKELGGFF